MYDTKYLVMVDPRNNHYKFYKMTPDASGTTFTAEWGRVGAGKTSSKVYPMGKWYGTLNSKLSKGYEDKTYAYGTQVTSTPVQTASKETKEKVKKEKNIKDEQIELYEFLKKFTETKIRKTFVNIGQVTQSMVDYSKQYLSMMRGAAMNNDVSRFNQIYLELLAICPRHVGSRHNGYGGVEDLLAHSTSDFDRILDDEDSLIQTMESHVLVSQPNVSATEKVNYIRHKVKQVTEAQMKEIKDHLPYSLRTRVRCAYRVYPEEQSKKFEQYCKDHDIKHKKLYWHGSRNENWLSIMDKSLLLNPDAIITGKMLGNGIYFAPDANKSWGYTSSGKWTQGYSETNIMGLYEVAYGNPYFAKEANDYTESYLQARGYDCVHARKGECRTWGSRTLYADEVVFYNEAALRQKYLVIFD